ncbi:MAG: hypothetical protein JO095_03830 [Alphaproteobacteria bacterium]|nr:hypothetical protein [Alphaproteobacteria bacterium]
MRAAYNLLLFTAISAILASVHARGDTSVTISYVPRSLAEASIAGGPWTLHQMVGRNRHDASGILPPSTAGTPFNPPTTAFGTPYKNYCAGGRVQSAEGINPMQPYYFPFVRANDSNLEGFFDYRPRNEQEATVSAISFDWGKSWVFTGQALGLNPYCPADPTDPDNNNVIVDGMTAPYGSNSANAADNGLGHAFVMTVAGVQRIYHLNRANGHIDSDQLVVHALRRAAPSPLAGLPALGYVSPLASRGYPALEPTAGATAGLQSPDAILGATKVGKLTTIIYVEKQLNASKTNNCASTPSWALTNIVTGKPRKANTDVITIRVATTTDGINFSDVGAVSGLQDPTTTAFDGIRWLGSGSIIPLSNGRYGMFFGAGNCLDNDSDGFHFIGYAETTGVVSKPSDLLSWTVIYGFDNPILSTDTVTDPGTGKSYPANRPLIDVANADVLTPAQVAPWVPPAGHNTNFFSGRVYDPQATVTDRSTVTIVFAGYNTPQPSSNLGDYRTIGRFQLRFPQGYIAGPSYTDAY